MLQWIFIDGNMKKATNGPNFFCSFLPSVLHHRIQNIVNLRHIVEAHLRMWDSTGQA